MKAQRSRVLTVAREEFWKYENELFRHIAQTEGIKQGDVTAAGKRPQEKAI